jgi:hypothetical protein
MKTLIEGLSAVYLPWKQEEYRKEREEKAAARKANEKKPSNDIEANESAASASAVLSAPKTGEDDNVKAVANGTNGDMDLSIQSDNESSSQQERMIV